MAASSDPIGTGFVASLARPGGNITGQSMLTPELSGKRLELLKEIVAGVSVVAVLWNPDDPPAAISLRETQIAADTLGIKIESVMVRAPDDFNGAFASAGKAHPQALIVLPAPLMTNHAGRIADLALSDRLPSISLEAISFTRSCAGMSGDRLPPPS
jgi:putative tryptophan/tyrosine transport system substrate-binding protein